MTTVRVELSRVGFPGDPGPVVLSGNDDAELLGISSFRSPGSVAVITYLPDEPDTTGSIPQAGSIQEDSITFGFFAESASEAAMHALVVQVDAALKQWTYTVTVTIGDAAPQTWTARMGSMELADGNGRSLEDLENSNPVFAVTIPVYPIPS